MLTETPSTLYQRLHALTGVPASSTNNHYSFVFQLSAPLYDHFFFTKLVEHVKGEIPTLHKFDCATSDGIEHFERSLFTHDLFSKQRVLWLGDLTLLPDLFIKRLAKICVSYQGPHYVIFYDAHQRLGGDYVCKVQFPEQVTYNQYVRLLSFFTPTISRSEPSVYTRLLFQEKEFISFQTALIAALYQPVVGKNLAPVFFEHYSSLLFETEISLFTLADLFFRRSVKALDMWDATMGLYPYPFWLRFWSDQLWFAYQFVSEAHEKRGIVVKDRSRRLPFSFTHNGWRMYAPATFVALHRELLHVDYQIKLGASEEHLGLFLIRFMRGEFDVSQF